VEADDEAMTLHLDQLFILGIFTTSIHWLVARSEIARPLWSRAHGWLEKLLRCPACSGFWLGGLVTWGGVQPFGDALAPWSGGALWPFVWKTQLAGIAAMFLTPVFEAVMVWGLRESAIVDEQADQAGVIETGTVHPSLMESGEVTPNERPRSG
jgi:hypothetical protein